MNHDAIKNLNERVGMILLLSEAITEANQVSPEAVESVGIYGMEMRVSLQGEDSLRRSFTAGLFRRLGITKLKRNIDAPYQLIYEYELEGKDRWSEKNLTFNLILDGYPCNFKVECEKTCYAVYEDGTRKAVVRKGKVGDENFAESVEAL